MRNITICFIFILIGISSQAQIEFNGCHPLFDDQNYTFVNDGQDTTGRNIFITNPVDGSQDCGGIGVCEFQIFWNEVSTRWEFIADDGNGDFSSSFLIYYNTEASIPNPPSLLLGTWVENTAVTESACGGSLSTSNAILSGDVQDTTLHTDDALLSANVSLYPNPANDFVTLKDENNYIKSVQIFELNGKEVMKINDNLQEINISKCQSGIYIVKLESYDNNVFYQKLIKE